MNGILIIDKPEGITSHDVVARVRRILGTKRVGHTGTLDPFATGVMVILVGQATRLAQFLDKDVKEYEALLRFGFETDTGDVTGSPKASVQSPTSPSVDDVHVALDYFRGEIEQIPPMYSAKKIDGKKLYELARKGETVERKPISVVIHRLEIMESSQLSHPQSKIRIQVACSAGTYIRTLAEDMGRRLGVGAHLEELRRTRAGKFTIDQSITLEKLAELDDPTARIVPMGEAISHLARLELNDERTAKTRNGLSTRVVDRDFGNGDAVQMIDQIGNLVAIGFFDAAENIVQPKVVMV